MVKGAIPVPETGKAFIEGLFKAVMGGGENSLQALDKLDGFANGGHDQARMFIRQIDDAVAAGELVLPKPEPLTELHF